ncbi:hypothetical protein TcWFU_001350 [Taenia crassiceps]|uniref:Uncharacterized protein n=1 Tax=Taenia crassiceps TaxID=6207 RepID=A0ABR4QFQ3_9CEST
MAMLLREQIPNGAGMRYGSWWNSDSNQHLLEEARDTISTGKGKNDVVWPLSHITMTEEIAQGHTLTFHDLEVHLRRSINSGGRAEKLPALEALPTNEVRSGLLIRNTMVSFGQMRPRKPIDTPMIPALE